MKKTTITALVTLALLALCSNASAYLLFGKDITFSIPPTPPASPPANATGTPVGEAWTGSWLNAFWEFWTTLFSSPLEFIPVMIFFFIVCFIIWVKTRSIIVPAIVALVFLSVAGSAVVAWLGLGGLIIAGIVIFALIVAYLKLFY